MSFEDWGSADGFVDKKNWKTYSEADGSYGRSWQGYLTATVDITTKITELMNNPEVKTLEEFKQQMKALCDERKKFVEHAEKRTPD